MSCKIVLDSLNSKNFQPRRNYQFDNLSRYALIMCVLISAISITATAQPRKLLGDDGALVWVEATVRELGFYSIEGGERSMIFFSAARAEDSRRLIYYQIYSLDGNREFEQPQPISDPGMVASFGAGTRDAEGNMYIGWYAAPPEDRTDVHLYVKKFDADGEELWGDENIHRFEADSALVNNVNEGRGIEFIAADGRGGCYLLSYFGLYAISENGQFRAREEQGDIWEELADRQTMKPISDGDGGIWITHYDAGYRWEHVRYDGTRIWHDYRLIQPDGIEGEQFRLIGGCIGGGVLTFIAPDNRVGVCIIDQEGQLVSNEHLFYFERSLDYRTLFGPFSDGGLFFVNEETIRGEVANTSVFSGVKYLPEENEFPWGEEGVELGRVTKPNDAPHSFIDIYPPTETPDGNVIFTMGNSFIDHVNHYEVGVVNQDGERIDQHSIQVEGNSRLHMAPIVASATEGGYWIYAYADSYDPPFPPPLFRLTWFTADGEPGIEDYIGTTIPDRTNIHKPTFWTDPDGNYRFLVDQLDNFVKLNFSEGGEALSPLDGEYVQGVNFKENHPLMGKILGNSIYYLCNSENDNHFSLASFDLEANHEWTVDIDVGNRFISHGDLTIRYLYEDNTLLIDAINVSIEGNNDRTYTPLLFKVGADDGDLIWRSTLPGFRTGGQINPAIITRNITYNGGFIYHSFYAQDYRFRFYKLSRNGNAVWRNPVSMDLDENFISCGIVPASSGGVYTGLYHDLGDSVTAWIYEISSDGDVVDSLNFFDGYTRSDVRDARYHPKFEMLRSQENIWIFSRNTWLTRDEINGVAQGLREDGTRLIWTEDGYRPQPDNGGNSPRITGGISDGAGGLWLLYYYPFNDNRNGAQHAIWLQPRPGYPNNPIQLMDNPTNAGLSDYWVEDNGDLITLSHHASENFRHVWNNYAYRLQRIRHPEELSSREEAPLPAEFSLKAAYPNPFNSTTLISYSVPVASHISLNLYNLAGREIRTLVEGNQKAGSHFVTLNADKLASGMYFARMEAGGKLFTRKILLIK